MALLDPYSGPWTTSEAAHLARRAAFGARPDELTSLVGMGMSAAVDHFVDFAATDSVLDAQIAAFPDDTTDLGNVKNPKNAQSLNGYWIWRMVHSNQPGQEQLALFLHDTLVSEFSKVQSNVPGGLNNGNDGSIAGQSCTGGTVAPATTNVGQKTAQLCLAQLALFRTDGAGPYRALLRKITRDPAMLLYLDNYVNTKSGAQENYAREVMELFTMGVGNYSEDDVRQVAKAFTGETVDLTCANNWSLNYFFNATKHDTTTKTVFGTPFNNAAPSADTDFVLDLIFGRISGAATTPWHGTYPATAIFIAWKFLTWFVQESIPIDHAAVGELAPFFLNNQVSGDGYNIRETLRKLLKSQLFYDMQYRYGMYKNPVDYVVNALRSLQIEESGYSSSVYTAIRGMGMSVYGSPTVAGWPQGAYWINSSNMITRFNYGDRLSNSARMTSAYCDALISGGAISGFNDHAGMIEYFRARLIHEPLLAGEQQPLLSFLTGIGNATTSAKYYTKVRGLTHLFLTMPRYQLK